jgi:hypothetical protein
MIALGAAWPDIWDLALCSCCVNNEVRIIPNMGPLRKFRVNHLHIAFQKKTSIALMCTTEGSVESVKTYKENVQDFYVRYFWDAVLRKILSLCPIH